jgi:hypothetical protein
MNFKFVVPIAVVLSLSLVSCAHTHRGVVAMKISDEEAHVVLGSHEVKPGDQISLYQNKCRRPLGGVHQGVHNDPVCEKVKIGGGEVLQVINENYSVIRVSPGVKFEEGTVVEKK